MPFHWGMSIANYPFFKDIAAIVGRLLKLQESISIQQVSVRMRENWGERSTLIRATQRVVRSMADWGVLRENSQKGYYLKGPRIPFVDKKVEIWLLESFLYADPEKMYSFEEVANSPVFFPFDFKVSDNELIQNKRVEMMRHGLDSILITLKKDNKPRL